MSLHVSNAPKFKLYHVPICKRDKEVCLLQELLALTDAAQLFEQIPLLAIAKMCGVDCTVITVSCPFCLLPTLYGTTKQRLPQLKMPAPCGLSIVAILCINKQK